MKILLDHNLPFLLAHGGMQTQIEQTKAALEQVGLEVEYLRWWDETQRGDILHHFGRTPEHLIRFAQLKGIKVVQAELLTSQGSRPLWRHRLQRLVMRTMETTLPRVVTTPYNWQSYRLVDAAVALTPWEARLMVEVFGASPDRVHVVPNGVEDVFLNGTRVGGDPWLVCTATITERKRVLELAEAAVQARTPLWVIGKPYTETDRYFRQFQELAGKHAAVIRYEGAIQDRARIAQIYQGARGFVLLSAMESLSLSALEAAACQCPLLLSDLPWARTVFGNTVSYCPLAHRREITARHLRTFYDQAPTLPAPPKPEAWLDVARQLNSLYGKICASH